MSGLYANSKSDAHGNTIFLPQHFAGSECNDRVDWRCVSNKLEM